MCLMQYAHCHNYSKWCLTRLLRKEHAQKTELIVTRYPPDIVLIIKEAINGIFPHN
jgi:hypothetical protein